MSKTVDQRVVEMQFDNRHFERNVATSMSTLEKLKRSLKLDGAAKSFDELNRSAKNVNLSGIGGAVETVSAKFSALQVVGVTALANITNSAIDAGKRIVKALTIDPVSTGFNEYELKMGSIQTIMAGTGESLDRVNQKLDELNKYSDDTIYSFKDMTDNIGKFTNAGVGLDDAVDAIKGISNVAAVSGATANEASRAMYNFSQALSAGYVQLIDWKSIELANMGTAEFRQQLIDAAVATGTLTKKSEGLYKTIEGNEVTVETFRNTLSDKWLTSDVLIKTLKEYADGTTEIGKKATAAATEVKTFSMMMDTLKESVQSGWAKSWEIIVGDFEQAKQLFTNLSKFFGGFIDKMSNARNDLLEGVLSSPWTSVSKSISEAGIELDDFKAQLVKAAKAHNKELDKMSDKELTFDKLLKDGYITKGLVVETLKDYASEAGESSKSTEDMTEKLKYFQKVVNDVWRGDYKNGKERIEALTAAGYDYAEVQALVNKTVNGHKLTLEDLSEEQLKSVGYTEEQIEAIKKLANEAEKAGTPLNDLLERLEKKSGRELILESFSNLLEKFTPILNAVKEAWDGAFGDVNMSDTLYRLIEKFHDFTVQMEISGDAAANFKKVFEGLFAIFQISNMMFSMSLTAGIKILSAVLELFGTNILEVAGHIADYIVKLRDWIEEHTIFINIYEKIAKVITTFINGIKRCVDVFLSLSAISNAVTKIKDKVLSFFGDIGKGIDGTGIDRFCAMLDEMFTRLEAWIKSLEGSENLGEDLLDGLINGLKAGVAKVVDLVMNLGKIIIETICAVLGIHSPSKVFFAIGGFIVAGLIAGLAANFGSVMDLLKSFGGKCVEVFENISLGQVIAALLSAGMLAMVYKIIKITEMFAAPAKGLGKMLEGLGSLADSIGKSKLPKVQSKWTIIANAILKVAIAIGVMALAITTLGKMEANELKTATLAMLLLVGAISAIMAVATLLSKVGKTSVSFGSVLVIAGALWLISGALIRLTKINLENAPGAIALLTKVAIGMMGMVWVFGALSKVNPKIFSGIGTLMLKLSFALLIMTGVLKLMSMLTDDEIKRSLVVVTGLEVLFAALVGVSKFAGAHAAKAGTMLLAMSVAMLVMIGVLKLASLITTQDVEKAIGNIALVMTLFMMIVAVSNLAGANAAKAGVMLLAMSVAMLIMIGVVDMASKLDETTVKKGVGVVALIEALFAGIIAVSSMAGDNAIKAGVMLLAMSGAIAIITIAIYALTKMDPAGLERALGVVMMLGVMFGAILAVSSIAQSCTVTLVLIGVIIGLLTASIVAISQVPAEDARSSAESLSILLLAFSGALFILSKMADPSIKSLVAIGIMTGVIVGLAFVLKSLSDLNPEQSIEIVKVLTIFLGALLAATAIMGLLRGPSASAIVALAATLLVVGMLAYVLLEVQNVDPGQAMGMVKVLSVFLAAMVGVCLAASLVGAVASLAIPGLAILTVFIGALGLVLVGLAKLATDVIHDMPQLGEDLSAFMENVQPFVEGANNIPDDISGKIGKLCGAILKLAGAEIINALASFLSGGNTLADLGNELKAFGDGATALANSAGSVDSAIDSINKIKDIQKSIDGVDISSLNVLGKEIKTYSDTMASINVAGVGASVPVITQLVKMVQDLVGLDMSGVTAFKVTPIANELQAYATIASNTDAGLVNESISSITRFKNVINSLTELNTSGVSEFKTAIQELGNISISSVVAVFDGSESRLAAAGSGMMNAVVVGFESKIHSFVSTVGSLSDKAVSKAGSSKAKFRDAGTTMIDELTDGFADGKTTLLNKIASMLNAAVEKAKTYYISFYRAGKNMVDGFADGISDKTWRAEAKASAMAKAAVEAAQKALDINSPSKVFKRIGMAIPEGFALGIDKFGGAVENSTDNMTSKAINIARDSIAMINSIVENDMQPTISPVLDLTNVKAGTSAINGMLGIGASIGVHANVGAISSIMSARSQNGTNGDVVTAIDRLRKDLGKTGNTYNSINGISYDDGSNVSEAIKTLVRAAKIERRT